MGKLLIQKGEKRTIKNRATLCYILYRGFQGVSMCVKSSVFELKNDQPAEALPKLGRDESSLFHLHSATQVREDHAEHGKFEPCPAKGGIPTF